MMEINKNGCTMYYSGNIFNQEIDDYDEYSKEDFDKKIESLRYTKAETTCRIVTFPDEAYSEVSIDYYRNGETVAYELYRTIIR